MSITLSFLGHAPPRSQGLLGIPLLPLNIPEACDELKNIIALRSLILDLLPDSDIVTEWDTMKEVIRLLQCSKLYLSSSTLWGFIFLLLPSPFRSPHPPVHIKLIQPPGPSQHHTLSVADLSTMIGVNLDCTVPILSSTRLTKIFCSHPSLVHFPLVMQPLQKVSMAMA